MVTERGEGALWRVRSGRGQAVSSSRDVWLHRISDRAFGLTEKGRLRHSNSVYESGRHQLNTGAMRLEVRR